MPTLQEGLRTVAPTVVITPGIADEPALAPVIGSAASEEPASEDKKRVDQIIQDSRETSKQGGFIERRPHRLPSSMAMASDGDVTHRPQILAGVISALKAEYRELRSQSSRLDSAELPELEDVVDWSRHETEAEAFQKISVGFFKNGDYARALRHICIAYHLNPNDLEIQQTLGLVLAMNGHDAAAAKVFAAYIKAMPTAEIVEILTALGEKGPLADKIFSLDFSDRLEVELKRINAFNPRLAAALILRRHFNYYMTPANKDRDATLANLSCGLALPSEHIDESTYYSLMYDTACLLALASDNEYARDTILCALARSRSENDLKRRVEYVKQDTDLDGIREALDAEVDKIVKAHALVREAWAMDGYVTDRDIRTRFLTKLDEAKTSYADLDELNFAYACYFALEGQKDQALEFLEKIRGNTAFHHRIITDTDLNSLYEKPEYIAMVENFNEDFKQPPAPRLFGLFG